MVYCLQVCLARVREVLWISLSASTWRYLLLRFRRHYPQCGRIRCSKVLFWKSLYRTWQIGWMKRMVMFSDSGIYRLRFLHFLLHKLRFFSFTNPSISSHHHTITYYQISLMLLGLGLILVGVVYSICIPHTFNDSFFLSFNILNQCYSSCAYFIFEEYLGLGSFAGFGASEINEREFKKNIFFLSFLFFDMF